MVIPSHAGGDSGRRRLAHASGPLSFSAACLFSLSAPHRSLVGSAVFAPAGWVTPGGGPRGLRASRRVVKEPNHTLSIQLGSFCCNPSWVLFSEKAARPDPGRV